MIDDSRETPSIKQPIPGYEVLERVGSGGMGTIFKARQISMNRVVALKVLQKSRLKDPLPLDRLRREALLIARMDHPNIVRGIDMGETDRYYFFAMEFIEGRSLQATLDLFGAMDEAEAIRIVRDVTRALHYAFEQKLTHRDIKPGNILISVGGPTKLADLGLAKGESDLTLTREGTTLGTPQYISPEQARTPQKADIRSDIYSLGATFYHMVTGRMPFEGESMAQVLTQVLFDRPDLPETVRAGLHPGTSRVISKMMAKEPSKRYQTPSELLDDLDLLAEAIADGSKNLAGFLGMTWRESQRRRSFRLLYWLAPVLLVSVLWILFIYDRPGSVEAPFARPNETPWSVVQLQKDYTSGQLLPLEVHFRLDSFGSSQTAIDLKAKNDLKNRVIRDCENLIDELFSRKNSLILQALAEGGWSGAPETLKHLASSRVEARLGGELDQFPLELKAYYQSELEESMAGLNEEATRLESLIIERAEDKLELRKEQAADYLSARRYTEAWSAAESLASEGPALLGTAFVEIFLEQTGAADWTPKKGKPFIQHQAEIDFQKKAYQAAVQLKERIKQAGLSARRRYLDDLKERIERLLTEGSTAVLERGVPALIRQAMDRMEGEEPVLPETLGPSLIDLAVLEGEFEPLWNQQSERARLEQNEAARFTLFERIDLALSNGDFSGAQSAVREAGARGVEDPKLLGGWSRRLKALQEIETNALKTLESYRGLDVRLKTKKGVVYEGMIMAISSASGTVKLSLPSDRSLEISLTDLHTEDLLYWAGKTGVLDAGTRGLFAYYRGDEQQALYHLKQAGDFPDASLYLDKITQDQMERETASSEAGQLLNREFEEVEAALLEGDCTRGITLLTEMRKRYRASPIWSKARRRWGELEKTFNDLQSQAERQARLTRLFSVPVRILESGDLQVTYTFSSSREMNDFSAYGNAWRV
ncbi:MAG: serine/threonine protein kinase, partial [Planctomycetes bacterium]|nr:serine/threonine protein kinase [Planctomycetota bacterium]